MGLQLVGSLVLRIRLKKRVNIGLIRVLYGKGAGAIFSPLVQQAIPKHTTFGLAVEPCSICGKSGVLPNILGEKLVSNGPLRALMVHSLNTIDSNSRMPPNQGQI